MKIYIRSDTEIHLNNDEQYKILRKFKYWIHTTFEPYEFSGNNKPGTPSLMLGPNGVRYLFSELYSDSWVYGILPELPKVILRIYVYLDDEDCITDAEVYCNFKDKISRNSVESLRISSPHISGDIEIRYPDIFSNSPYCKVTGLSIPNFDYDDIPIDVSYLVKSLRDFYNGIRTTLLEMEKPKPTSDNQSAIRSIIRKNNYDRKQTYEMNYRIYSDRGHTGSVETDEIYTFTAPGDYWALFGMELFKNITPKNLSEKFNPDDLIKIVDKYPTFKSLLNSYTVQNWISPDEYTHVAYLQNLTTGKSLF